MTTNRAPQQPQNGDCSSKQETGITREGMQALVLSYIVMLLLPITATQDSTTSESSCSKTALPLYQHRQYDAAQRELEHCLRLDPKDPSSHELLGLVLDAAGTREQAGAHLREALTLANQNADYRFNLAMFLASTDQIEEANRIGQPLLVSQPGPDTYMLIGYLRLRQRQEREAAFWFQKAVDAAPGRANAWYRLGFAHHSLGEFSAAVICYRKTLELEPQHFFARLQLGKVLLLQGDYAGARDQLIEATRIQPGYSAAWRYLSEAQLSSGERQAALKSAREAVSQDSSDPRNHHQLGMVLEKAGDEPAAAAEFQTMEDLRVRMHNGTSSPVDPREY